MLRAGKSAKRLLKSRRDLKRAGFSTKKAAALLTIFPCAGDLAKQSSIVEFRAEIKDLTARIEMFVVVVIASRLLLSSPEDLADSFIGMMLTAILAN